MRTADVPADSTSALLGRFLLTNTRLLLCENFSRVQQEAPVLQNINILMRL